MASALARVLGVGLRRTSPSISKSTEVWSCLNTGTVTKAIGFSALRSTEVCLNTGTVTKAMRSSSLISAFISSTPAGISQFVPKPRLFGSTGFTNMGFTVLNTPKFVPKPRLFGSTGFTNMGFTVLNTPKAVYQRAYSSSCGEEIDRSEKVVIVLPSNGSEPQSSFERFASRYLKKLARNGFLYRGLKFVWTGSSDIAKSTKAKLVDKLSTAIALALLGGLGWCLQWVWVMTRKSPMKVVLTEEVGSVNGAASAAAAARDEEELFLKAMTWLTVMKVFPKKGFSGIKLEDIHPCYPEQGKPKEE